MFTGTRKRIARTLLGLAIAFIVASPSFVTAAYAAATCATTGVTCGP